MSNTFLARRRIRRPLAENVHDIARAQQAAERRTSNFGGAGSFARWCRITATTAERGERQYTGEGDDVVKKRLAVTWIRLDSHKKDLTTIFSIADLGVVGDVHKVLPKLLEDLGNR